MPLQLIERARAFTDLGCGLVKIEREQRHPDNESSCEANFVIIEVLEAVGAQCTAITSVGPCFEAGISDADLVQTLSKLMLFSHLHTPYVGGGDILSAYYRTFVLNNFADRYVPPLAEGLKLENARKGLLEIAFWNGGVSGAFFQNSSDYLCRSRLQLEGCVFFYDRDGPFRGKRSAAKSF